MRTFVKIGPIDYLPSQRARFTRRGFAVPLVDDALPLRRLGCETNDDEADDESTKASQSRDKITVHLGSPFRNRIPPMSEAKLIPTPRKVNSD